MKQSVFIPPLSLDDKDNSRVADISATLNPYKEQAMTEFITGKRDINSDADWSAYLADLDKLGSGELAAILTKYLK
jgi:hypothetical protein